MAKVFIVGAGPGDPELITVKGRRLLENADLIIYTGSLVNPEVVACCKKEAEIVDSAGLHLDEVIELISANYAKGRSIVRLHTGDPSLYGAIREQIDRLHAQGIPCEVVPGVSSFTAAAAALEREFTLPGISQTVICTRLAGRTPVPENEALSALARHQSSMAVFLSVQMIDQVVQELGMGYPLDTPVAIVEKATWAEQCILRGTLGSIAEQVRSAGITGTAMILVGRFLGDEYELSKLYDRGFTHGYRNAT